MWVPGCIIFAWHQIDLSYLAKFLSTNFAWEENATPRMCAFQSFFAWIKPLILPTNFDLETPSKSTFS
jgi:hypothetical protein